MRQPRQTDGPQRPRPESRRRRAVAPCLALLVLGACVSLRQPVGDIVGWRAPDGSLVDLITLDNATNRCRIEIARPWQRHPGQMPVRAAAGRTAVVDPIRADLVRMCLVDKGWRPIRARSATPGGRSRP